ncbi:protein tyrosine/serine phosphatase [Candidatus Magnetobacterium bavaricum]|uniref:Protein tyrosine/serine phosphatase n=1 Tax=Candidatus Magnetobacterium bavaricum TaxID=29290 RepID=A0A0F3GI20_9BACT|nr:protein tyrosine/serine phosphatase [Candidatus Magnetobacterium bavaricum]
MITAGKAYRSAQLDNKQLQYYIKKYKIASILNLRGENPGVAWYVDEINVSNQHNIAHYDVALSSEREPTDADVDALLRIFAQAQRPILIHCWGGADRSGLVSAMWKVAVENETKTDAQRQLSILYGHLPFGKKTTMDGFFRKWSPGN